MLTPVITRDLVARDASFIQVADITPVKGSDYVEYDENGQLQQYLNTNGFGEPDPVRAQLAWVAIAVFHGSKKEEVVLAHACQPTDPLLKTVTFPYGSDGYYKYYSFFFLPFDEGFAYADGAWAFFPGGEQPYSGLVKNYVGGVWVEVPYADLVTPAVYKNLPYKNFYEDFLDYKLLLKQAELIERRDLLRQEDSCHKDLAHLRRQIAEVKLTIDAACAANQKGYPLVAYDIIRGASV